MKNTSERNLIYTVTALILTAGLIVTAVFAWFPPAGLNNSFSVSTGELDLVTQFYVANDTDKDGMPDAVPGVSENLKRGEKIKTYYTAADKNGIAAHGNFIAGNKLTFKLVVLNPLNNSSAAVVDFAFAALDGYVFAALDCFADTYTPASETNPASGLLVPAGTSENTLFDGFSARTMFILENFSVNIYSSDSASDGLTEGYDQCVASTEGKEGAETLTAPSDKKLWEVSDGQKITEPFALGRGKLLEVDFCLTLMQLSDTLINEYTQYAAENYIPRCEAILGAGKREIAAAYIEAFVTAEMNYQNYNGDGSSENERDNYFEISKIYVYGRQTAVNL